LKTHLLCTFTHKQDLTAALDYITSTYVLPENKIFVFTNSTDDNELFCTYNVVDSTLRGRHTILVHRKKESNTLYTVNALNGLIRTINNGILDKSFVIDWQQYRNSILLSDGITARQIELILYNVVKL
jgi:hypothetical protein